MDFLQRLAASALADAPGERAGDAARGGLRAALPSRFEPTSAARFDAAADDPPERDHRYAPSVPRAAVPRTSAPAAVDRRRDPARDPAHDSDRRHAGGASSQRADPATAPAQVALRGGTLRTPVIAGAGEPRRPHDPRHGTDASAPPSERAAAVAASRPPEPDGHRLALARDAFAREALARDARALIASWPSAPPHAAAPLDASVVASQPARAAAGPPVVHLSIDRIDVRAAAPAAPPSTVGATPRARTARTLADYLRGGPR